MTNLADNALDQIICREDANKAEFYSLEAILKAHNWTEGTWRGYKSQSTDDNQKSPPCFSRGRDAQGKTLYLFPINGYWEWVDEWTANPLRRNIRTSTDPRKRRFQHKNSEYSARKVLSASK